MSATRSLNTTRRKKPPQAFYEPASSQTSARIIEDARRSVRTLPTERPFTPADAGRILFGTGGSQSRPPSVYSIHARQFSASRPSTSQKLAPIERTSATDIIKKVSKNENKQTPPTPVQSLCNLTAPNPSGEPPASVQTASSITNSYSAERQLVSTSQTSLSSGASGDLELKQSKTSPTHSKRSSSAGKRVLSGGLSHQKDANRVSSAGEIRFSPLKDDHPATSSAKKKKAAQNSTSSQLSVTSVATGDSEQSLASDSRERPNDGRKSRKSSTVDLPFWDGEVVPLLSALESTSYSETTKLCEICDSLWSRLEEHNLLGRSGGVGGTKRRSTVLRTVFKLLDHKDPSLLLKVAKIITAMKVTGKNLLNVCKLLFALSKDEKNDTTFKEELISAPLVELLLSADSLIDCDAMVYGLGTLKLLASNSELREQLVGAGVVGLMASTLMKSTSEEASRDEGMKSRIRNVLIQLTGGLRNLSDASSLRGDFLSTGILPRLASVFSDHMTCSDIVFNISRLLSKLTLQSDCKVAVLHCPSYLPLLLTSLTRHADHTDVVVRVCFILGNLTSDDADTRHLLFARHSALPTLNAIFDKYLVALEREQGNSLPNGAGESDDKFDKKVPSKPEDVLIKLVRLVANLSIHPEVGPAVARDGDTVEYLLQILGHMSLSDHPQLVINTLVTLNNLTYYTTADTNSSVNLRHEEIAQLLVNVIVEDSNEGLLECTRVYGNLSRHPRVRAVLGRNKVDEMMVALLDSGQREVVYCACGVLVNLMADPTHRDVLAANAGIRKLVEVLHDFGHSDWQLASLVCKTLWNFSEQMTSSSLCFGEEETEQLIRILQTYSDESCTHNVQPDMTESNKQYLRDLWRAEFLPVAQALLSHVKAHYSALVPLEDPTPS